MATLSLFKAALLKYSPTNFHSSAAPKPEFQISTLKGGALKSYYAPFEHVNPQAKLVLVGITPGAEQMNLACLGACQALHAGKSDEEALALAKAKGSFGGDMRETLIDLLDHLGINQYLGIRTCRDLWGSANHLVHFTSVLRNPVFVVSGDSLKNYEGSSPDLDKFPGIDEHLLALQQQFAAMPGAVIFPLGEKVARVLKLMVDKRLVPIERMLNYNGEVAEFPHPSGQNGETHKLARMAPWPTAAEYADLCWQDYAQKPPRKGRAKMLKQQYTSVRNAYFSRVSMTRGALKQLHAGQL